MASCKLSALVLAIVPLLISFAAADCQSYGTDFVNGGSYFINDLSTEMFSFGTLFQGCNSTLDAQDGVITPILIAPDETEYFCSDIPVNPNGETFISTCDVTGNTLTKSEMYSGSWIIIIEGYTFAWMRTIYLTVGPQSTVTVTPTASFNYTTTPLTTITTTSTDEYDITLTPSTVTVPSATITRTSTVTPKRVTVRSTSTHSHVTTKVTYTVVKATSTKTAPCTIKKDPPCTIFPTKTSIASAVIATQAASAAKIKAKDRKLARSEIGKYRKAAIRDDFVGFEKRSPDAPTLTITATDTTVTVISTITAPTSTETSVTVTTTTQTITPPPITVNSGVTSIKVTVTAPTPTTTTTIHTYVTAVVTRTVTATLTVTSTTTPTCTAK